MVLDVSVTKSYQSHLKIENEKVKHSTRVCLNLKQKCGLTQVQCQIQVKVVSLEIAYRTRPEKFVQLIEGEGASKDSLSVLKIVGFLDF